MHTTKYIRSERGQSLVLFAIISVVFIGLLALALDVGYAYAIRRSSQNAADSGALAGASTLCGTGDDATRQTAAVTEAMKYAGDDGSFGSTNKVPGKTSQAAAVNQGQFALQRVGVTVTVAYNTLLGGIFGEPTNTIQATAMAGCKPGGVAEGALPVAKDCGTLTNIGTVSNPIYTCSEVDIDPNDDSCKAGSGTPAKDYDTMYVFVNDSENINNNTDPLNNTDKTDQYVCSKEWTDPAQKKVNCDYDGDGQMDMQIVSTANPFKDKWMWVDLSPTTNCTNSNCLKDVVQGKLNFFLNTPIWVPGGSGAHTVIYKTIETYREGDIVAVPVFNWTCKGTDPEDPVKCNPYGWVGGDQKHLDGGGSATNYFRIVSWAWFKITDVCQKNNCYGSGQNAVRKSMFYDTYVNQDGSTGGPAFSGGGGGVKLDGFEGCFVRMTTALVQGVSSSGVDTGVYSVYLIK